MDTLAPPALQLPITDTPYYYAVADQEGRGRMSAGLCATLDHAFGALELHQVEANIQPDNPSSIALVRRAGFRKEGYSPRYLKIDEMLARS